MENKMKKVLSMILVAAIMLSFLPSGIISARAESVAAEDVYRTGYTWAFDKELTIGATKGLVSGNAAGTIKVMSHEGNGNALTPSRAIADGVLTTEVVKNWGSTVGHGVFYQLPEALTAGKIYTLSLNIYGGNDVAAMNGMSVSFGDYTSILTADGGTIQQWQDSKISGMHNADTKITRSISGNLPTAADNTFVIEFVATEAMAANSGWMLVTFPLALDGSYKLGSATMKAADMEDGYTWKFDKTVEAFSTATEFKSLYYGNTANTVGIVNHEGYGSNWGENTSRSLKDGLLTSVLTASWGEAGHGVYYMLPSELVVGKTYRVSMNLRAAQENTPMTNDKSSSITVSFNSEPKTTQEWQMANMEGYHNAEAKFSIPAPASLSTQSDNVVSFEFVATQAFADAGNWMLITFPMEDNKTYILGDTTIETVNYNYADGYTWKFDKTIAFTNDNAYKVMQYGNVANTVGIISHSAYANYGVRSLNNGILTTNITATWAKGASGVYYRLPADLTAGQEYVLSMNLYASAEGTALVNGDSTSIKVSFVNEIPTNVTEKVDQYWTAAHIEGIHNTETLLTYRAPDYLSTDTANQLAVTFVATKEMAANDGWMLVSMPLAVNGEVNLGAVTMKEKNADNHFLNGDFSDGLTGWLTNHDGSYVSVQDSVLNVSDKVPTGDVKLYQAMYLEAGSYRLSFDVLGAPASWRPVYFIGTAVDNSSVTGSQLRVDKESGITADGWWTVTRDVTIATAGTYYFQMNLNQVSDEASVAPAMQYDNFKLLDLVTVTWKNADDSVLKTEKYLKGATPAYTGDEPTLEATDSTVYTFAGWTPEIVVANEDATYTATYTEATRTYTVTWIVDGVETTETYAYGATPVYTGSTDKATVQHTSYTFSGWDSEIAAVTGDVTYTAQYEETVSDHEWSEGVCGICGEGHAHEEKDFIRDEKEATCTEPGYIKQTCGVCGKQISYSEMPPRHEWDAETGECKNCDAVCEHGMWIEGTCSYCGMACVHTGGQANCAFPAICEICGQSYGEIGTHIYVDGACTVCGEKSVHIITWIVDGEVSTSEYPYGAMPEFIGSTNKAEDEDYTYEFIGWDKEIEAVTGDVTYTAQFNAIEKIKYYTVTWNVNGVETTETYAPGEVPSFKGSTVKASDETNYYTFTGWDKALAEVDGDVTYTAQYATTKLINFLGATVVMGNNLDMKFAISPSAVANAGGVSVVIKRSFGDGRADEVTTIPVSELPTQSGVYAVVYSGLAAKQMCDIVTLTVVNADGQPVSQPWTDSMRDYAMRTYAKASTTDLQKTLFVDMLNYGAAAQSFFNYNVEDLANGLLTDEQKAMASKAKDFTAGFEFDKTKWSGSRLVIESNISFQMAFKNAAGKKATVEFTDNRGNEKKYEYVLDDIGGLYINELVLADARQAMTVTVYNADGSVYYTCNESIEDYLARAATVTDLQRMIMKYSDTAREYLATLD